MGSQVTILATLPRSDRIQMKSRRVLCWPKAALAAPPATGLLQEAAWPGQEQQMDEQGLPQHTGQDELSLAQVHLRAGACRDNREMKNGGWAAQSLSPHEIFGAPLWGLETLIFKN